MDIFQLVGIGIVGAVASVILKAYRPEFALCTALITAGILLIYIVQAMGGIVDKIEQIMIQSGLEKKYFSAILKIIGISYITEFASQICKDAGEGAIALKLEMLGKVFVMLLSMPIIQGFLEVCTSAIRLL